METIEQTLDKWLDEYCENKNLRNRLAVTSTENSKEHIPDTTMIVLSKRDITVLLKGLDTILQSNKESIIDCSYNIVQLKKQKSNTEHIEQLEQITRNHPFWKESTEYIEEEKQIKKETKQESEKPKESEENENVLTKINKILRKFKQVTEIRDTTKFDNYLSEITELLHHFIPKTKGIWIKFKNPETNSKNEEILSSLLSFIADINDVSKAKEMLKDESVNSIYLLFIPEILNKYAQLRVFVEMGGTITLCTDTEDLNAVEQIKKLQ